MTRTDRVRLRIAREDLLQLEKCLTREWLLTNGRGGYASSTPLLCPTRRYHGLLVVPPPGAVKRHVFLTRYEESLYGGGRTFPLSIARYSGTWAPVGHQSIEGFELAPWPVFHYRIGEATVTREVLLVRDEPAVLCRYVVRNAVALEGGFELRLRPLLACREADALTFENLALSTRVTRIERGFRVQPYESLPEVAFTAGARDAGAGFSFEADPLWYRGIEYRADLDRGYDGHEDNYSPGVLHVPFGGERGGDLDIVVACTLEAPVADPFALYESESNAQRACFREAFDGSLRSMLAVSADDFLYRSETGRCGVIAGWPWFGEWGRDTFLALPGLTLARGAVESCGDALSGALPYLKDGLLPNIYGAGRADSHYGSVDASLWFARCVRLYELAGGSPERIRDELLPALLEIGRCYRDGTGLGIACDDGGLIVAGNAALNATWMDARTADGPVTPRDGCAVEINALWYFLLAYLEQLCGEPRDARRPNREGGGDEWGRLRARAGRTFLERFWLPEARYLADVWKDGVADRSVRPNMVIAAALELSPLTRGMRTDIVAQAEVELLTPRGLRTLAPDHESYEGHYRGNQDERDRAYHQGTVWPWLLGFYVEAYFRAHGHGEREQSYVRALLDGFADHVVTQGLGHVSEVFDGDPPHRPGGTIAQAWSTAELLRAFALLEVGP